MSTGHPAGTWMDPWRAKACRFTAVKRHQHPLNEQVGPAEAGVPPRDVICVHHGRARDGVLQRCRQRGLPARAASIYGQHYTLAARSSPVTKLEQALSNHRQRYGTPQSAFGLLGSELDCPTALLPRLSAVQPTSNSQDLWIKIFQAAASPAVRRDRTVVPVGWFVI
jgi:hypothetical protein